MAIPAILGVAARKTGTALWGATKLAAQNGLRASVSAQRNRAIDAGTGAITSWASSRSDAKRRREEERQHPTPSKPSQKQSNEEKAERDERANRERQERLKPFAPDESTGVLKVISKDTKDILAGIELLVEEGIPVKDKEKSGGLLSGIMALLGSLSLMSKNFLPTLGSFLARAAPKLGASIASMISKSLGSLIGTITRMGGGVAKAAGVVGKAALTAGGALAAKGVAAGSGALSKGTAAAKAAGTTTGAVAKTAGKTAGKVALKKIPIIGAGVGLALAANRAMAGDWVGAGMEASSGLMSMVPGLGTAASLGMDAAIIARDVKRSGQKPTDVEAPKPDFSNVKGSVSDLKPAPKSSATDPSQHSQSKSPVEVMLESMMWSLRTMVSNMISPNKGIYTQPSDDAQSKALDEEKLSFFSSLSEKLGDSSAPSSGRGKLDPLPPMHEGLGGLSARYESGNKGSEAVGWDSTGGTSYGKYQIATRTGTMSRFMDYLKTEDPEAFERLQAAGPADTGKNGNFAKVWQQMAKEGKLGDHEHEFIKRTHYDPGLRAIKSDDLRGMIGKSSALQDVLWSTTVQHGGSRGAGIFDKVYKDGMSEDDLIKAIYAERGTRFGSSSASVRASVQNRFKDEQRNALAMIGRSPDAPVSAQVRESVVNQSAQAKAPIIVSAPTAVAPQSGGKSGPSGMGYGGAMAIRNPDSPIGVQSLILMGII